MRGILACGTVVLALMAMGCESDIRASAQEETLVPGGGAPFAGTSEGGGTVSSSEGGEIQVGGEEGNSEAETVLCGTVGAACDDTDLCTVNDTCGSDGICVGEAVLCEDGIVCTDDFCSEGSCVHVVLNTHCLIDGICYSDGQASPAGGCLVCDSDTQPESWASGEVGGCDDGDSCTLNDTCTAGGCTGTPLPCSDEDPCTSDACTGGACVFTPIEDCSPGPDCMSDEECADMDPCTEDSCESGSCVYLPVQGCGSPPECQTDGECDDGNACTSGNCANGTCVFSPLSGVVCDDGNTCSVGDMCQSGACTAGSGQKDSDADGAVDKACGGTDCNDASGLAKPSLPEDCSDGLDNDCNDLIDDEDPACANSGAPLPCTHHADCATDQLCGYWPTFGSGRCSELCANEADCGAGLVCAHVPGSANVGLCRSSFNSIGGGTGTPCTVGADCFSEICASGQCSPLCTDEDSCVSSTSTCYPGGSLDTGFSGVCSPDSTYRQGVQTGQSCGTQGGGICLSGHCDLMAEPGNCAAICGTDGDCSFSQECGLIVRSNGPIGESMPYDPFGFADLTYDGILGCFQRPSLASAPIGSICTIPDECRSNKCLPIGQAQGDTNGYCTSFCTQNTDCPQGMACLPGVVTLTSNWLELEGLALETKGTVARLCRFQ